MQSNTNIDSHYIHGSSAEEQQRLSLLNRLMNKACLQTIQLRGDERMLDMGSGLGQFDLAIAETDNFRGSILGIERDEQQLASAKKNLATTHFHNIEFRQGNAFHPPLTAEEWGSFDLAHTRFLLEHVPQPRRVVQQMYQAVRPGGRLVLVDEDHDIFRVWPDAPGFRDLWLAYVRSYERLGNDPFIGRRLVSLLHEAGCRDIRNTFIFFGSCASNPNFQLFMDNFLGLLVGARELLLQRGLITEYTFHESVQQLQKWRMLPDAAIWFAMSYAEGVK